MKTSKEEIIQKCLQVIWVSGFHDTSISKLSKACGIHTSHFYYYFEHKENLMQEVLVYVIDQFKQKIFSIPNDSNLTTAEKLDKIIQKLKRFYLQSQGGCLMANTALESAGKNYQFVELLKEFFQGFIDVLSKIYGEKYDPATAQSYAEQAVQDVEGGIILMRLFQDQSYFLKALERARK